jgi:hypothetical protein
MRKEKECQLKFIKEKDGNIQLKLLKLWPDGNYQKEQK